MKYKRMLNKLYPTNNPDLIAAPIFILKKIPNKNMTTGNITTAPKLKIPWKNSKNISIFIFSPLNKF